MQTNHPLARRCFQYLGIMGGDCGWPPLRVLRGFACHLVGASDSGRKSQRWQPAAARRDRKRTEFRYCARWAATLLLALAAVGPLRARPYDGNTFRGRIAWSADGNHNDPDDWIASPMALAIFATAGLRDRVVHFDYNCILPQTNPEWERIHAESVHGAAQRYGYEAKIFFDCRQHLDAAVADLTAAINASSAEDPLYFVVAGPMEVPYLAIQKSDPAKRQFIYCISHSRWNDGFASQYKFSFTKRSVIAQDVHWVQIPDQNRLLAFGRFGQPSPPAEFSPYFWLRDSRDPVNRWLWERMAVSTRPDPSDAGMAWFVATGDETCDPAKLRAVLEERRAPVVTQERATIRLEAENFRVLENCALNDKTDRNTSHRLDVRFAKDTAGQIRTRFEEPFAHPRGRYEVEVRYWNQKGGRNRYTFGTGGRHAPAWESSADETGWSSHTLRDVALALGDELTVAAEGPSAGLDYVQLKYVAAMAANVPTFPAANLDDPAALPGGLIVAGSNPGYLKYNGGRAVFLSGPDDPEDFLYRGTLNPDGTRSGGGQSEIIRRLAAAGVNAFHCQIFRMQRCNFKKEGDDTHCPFVNHDPTQPLNQQMLEQWDGWITELERAGIVVDFEFYNDATDVELMGWKLDAAGNLPPDERRMFAGIVERFKHHKNILWCIEESCNKLPRARVPHFKKLGALIAQIDNYHHPIAQSFVVPGDPEGDYPKEDAATTDDYAGDPNIRVVTWLHIVPQEDDLEKAHQQYLHFAQLDGRRFVAMKNETYYKGYLQRRPLSRQYIWASALTGLHMLEAQHKADRAAHVHLLEDDARLRGFMEDTDFFRMRPHDELAAGATKWVLAQPGESYIAYSYAATGPMGVAQLTPGTYQLVWFDPITGERQVQKNVTVKAATATWLKPASMNNEIALYVKRLTAAGPAGR